MAAYSPTDSTADARLLSGSDPISETENLLDLAYEVGSSDTTRSDRESENDEEEISWEKENTNKRMCKSATFHDFCDDSEHLRRAVTTLPEEEFDGEEEDEFEDASDRRDYEDEEEDDEDEIVVEEEEVTSDDIEEHNVSCPHGVSVQTDQEDTKNKKKRKTENGMQKMKKSSTFASFLNMFVARRRSGRDSGANRDGERLMSRSSCLLRPSISLCKFWKKGPNACPHARLVLISKEEIQHRLTEQQGLKQNGCIM